MTMKSKASVLSYLYGLQKFGIKLGLRNSEVLLQTLGHPERDFPSVHVAGTNGKGSTSSMIASMLRAAGYTVGLYTSPHLIDFNERIRVNGKKISDTALIRYAARLQSVIDERGATFFEATTAIAFRYFADRRVDIAVIETGLGGRLDATNVLKPLVSVITTIGLDHTTILGTTIGRVAREKAGIIKRGVPCVMGVMPAQAQKVILRCAVMNSSRVIAVEDITVDKSADGSLSFQTTAGRHTSIDLSLKGAFQRSNAAAALAAVDLIQERGFPVSESAIRDGLHRVQQLSGIEARLQRVGARPLMICDVAHNPDAINVLAEAVAAIPHASLHIIFGVMKDKDYRVMIRRLVLLRPKFYAVQASIERTLTAHEAAAAIREEGGSVRAYAAIASAVRAARRAASTDDLILVTGSHYIVGDALRVIKRRTGRKK